MQKHAQAVTVTSSAAVLLAGLWLLRTQLAFSDAIETIGSAAGIKSVSVVVAQITSPVALVCVALFAAFLAVETHHVYAWLQIATALIITMAICWLLKEIIQLPRPANAQLITTGFSEYAFPSTHAASAGTVAVLAGFHARRLTTLANTTIYLPLSVGVIAVGISRVALRAHTISDVLAGLVLGISLGLLAAMMWSRWYQLLRQLNEHQQGIT